MSSKLRQFQWMIRLMGYFQIPLIGWVRPKLVELDDRHVLVKIKLRRRTRNHLKSMYFGALAIGADVAAGIHVFYYCDALQVKPSFSFKAVDASFLKRVETAAFFRCEEGEIIAKIVQKARETNERQNAWVCVSVLNEQQELVAIFKMEISVKIQST